MEILEDFMTAPNDHSPQIVKGKRTKRQRTSSPFGVTSSSSSGGSGGGGGGGGGYGSGFGGGGEDGQGDYGIIPSPTTSGEISTEEEEDMANCLILLAQSGGPRRSEEGGAAKMATTTTSKAGFFVYACKTCNRTFPSFQALGGHRASHKKPKAMVESKKMAVMATAADDFEEREFDKTNTTTLSLQIPNKALHGNKSNKVHECSICGSEFTSGQALGGHMRRHRTSTIGNQIRIMTMDASTTTTTTTESRDTEKPRSILSLDLNLPAPEDDHHRFASNQQPLVFSAAALVDCHY